MLQSPKAGYLVRGSNKSMKRHHLKILPILAILAAGVCSAQQTAKATVHFYRVGHAIAMQALPVCMDGKQIGSLALNSEISIHVAVGDHAVLLSPPKITGYSDEMGVANAIADCSRAGGKIDTLHAASGAEYFYKMEGMSVRAKLHQVLDHPKAQEEIKRHVTYQAVAESGN
jgi:hypothetical protein